MKRTPSETFAVNVKLTKTEKFALDTIIESHCFDSRSAALRAGLGLLFEYAKLDKSFDAKIEKERRLHRPRCRKRSYH